MSEPNSKRWGGILRAKSMTDQEANSPTSFLSHIFAETGSLPVFHIDETWFHIRRQLAALARVQGPSQSPDLKNINDLGLFAWLQLQLPSDLTIVDHDAGPAPQ